MTLYNMFMSKMNQVPVQQAANSTQPMPQQSIMPQQMNPMQKMQMVMQAMQNPAAFVKRVFPDIPDMIQNNPDQILQYLQRTRNISNDQIQNTLQQIPKY